MSYHTTNCDRCGSTIVEQHPRPERMTFYRELPENNHESQEARLCSVCLDDVWECVFNEDVDRSNKTDPKSINRLKEGVIRHKEELEDLIEQLEEQK